MLLIKRLGVCLLTGASVGGICTADPGGRTPNRVLTVEATPGEDWKITLIRQLYLSATNIVPLGNPGTSVRFCMQMLIVPLNWAPPPLPDAAVGMLMVCEIETV